MKVVMLRLLSACGMGGVFLMISPNLRTDVMGKFADGVRFMDVNAPLSYVGGVVFLLVVFCISLYRGAQAH